jgi:hypothetical protein
MVGTLTSAPVAVNRSQPESAVASGVLGQAEGDPTAVVTVATGSSVSEVAMSFTGGGTDQMAPVKGWAILAGAVPASLAYGQALGTLVAKGAGGQTLASAPLTLGSLSVGQVVPCGYRCGTQKMGTAAQIAPTPGCVVGPPCGPLPGQVAPALPKTATSHSFTCPATGAGAASGSTSGGASTRPAITTTPAGG